MSIPDAPLISCIMPTTAKRCDFLPQAIRLFLAQDWPSKELIIIEDTTIEQSMSELIPDDPRIQFVSVDMLLTMQATLTIGAKRNLACSLARGEYIAHWDDDDYFGPHRLSKQVAPLLAGRATVTAMRMTHMLDLASGALWHCSPDTHRSLFAQNVKSGTLMYQASYWREQGVSYSNSSRGEDVRFLLDLIAKDARLEQVTDPHSYICVRHDDNVTDALHPASPDWLRASLSRYVSPQDAAFYQSFQRVVKEGGL